MWSAVGAGGLVAGVVAARRLRGDKAARAA
jgi:hypothetical protein